MRRRVAPISALFAWYSTATGIAYALLIVLSVVATVFAERLGLAAVLVVIALAIPYKLARLDGQRRADQRDRYAMRKRHNDLRTQHEHLQKQCLELRNELAEMRKSVKRVGERSQQIRRDSLTAVDTARHEWAEIIRAERRTTEATVRSGVRRELAQASTPESDDGHAHAGLSSNSDVSPSTS